MDMDMKKLEFLDIYPDPISGSEKGYISISYIQHLDIYPGYISNGYISYPGLKKRLGSVNHQLAARYLYNFTTD